MELDFNPVVLPELAFEDMIPSDFVLGSDEVLEAWLSI
jgi:hypothetical protein